MTHSLHREGSPESLEKDYVMFIYPARGFNYKGSAPKVRHLAELIFLSGPVGIMAKERSRSMNKTGKPDDTEVPIRIKIDGENIPGADPGVEKLKLEEIQSDGTRVYSTFDNRESLREALRRIKEADEGISIMVSGLTDRVREIAAEIGIDPHMINLSLGIHGRTDRLPPGGYPGVHDDVRPRPRITPPDQGYDPQGQDREDQRMGREPVHRGALHLRHLQPLPFHGTSQGKGSALHGNPLVTPMVSFSMV